MILHILQTNVDLQQMIPDSYALEQYGTLNSHKYQYKFYSHFQYIWWAKG